MRDEGYIKYDLRFTESGPVRQNYWRLIESWRNRLWALGMIGVYPDGISYGNISMRIKNTDQMIITGSGTGNLQRMDNSQYAKVESVEISENRVRCRGPVHCSSEAMTHYLIYQEIATVRAVIHVHSGALWRFLKYKVPTVSEDVAYGTPAMAEKVSELLRDEAKQAEQVIVMAGHDEGILFFGSDLDSAGSTLLSCRGKMYRAQDDHLGQQIA